MDGDVPRTKENGTSQDPCAGLAPKKELRFALDVADGLLSQDHEELCERVSYLEKKVQQQEDEIICLKSALADVIRRLGQAEAGRAQNSILPSKPAFRGSPRTKSSSSHSSRTSHLNALDNAHVTPARSNTPPATRSAASPRPSSSTSLSKKWSSMSNQNSISGQTSVRRSVSQSSLLLRSNHRGAKDPLWNSDEGYLKIYLRGRPVNLYCPSSITEYDISKISDTPDEKLRLEWVYGYRGRDCRSNLYYLPTGEMVYFSAAVVVLHNIEENTQRHYVGHTDDVKCLAIHPDKIKVASGQVAGHSRVEGKKFGKKTEIPVEDREHWPHIRVWDSVSLNTIHVVGVGEFDRAVCCISFSKLDGGHQLVAVDDANEHVISVWDISRDSPRRITETKSSTEPVLAVEFHPSEKNSIISCGKGQINFWTMEGGTLARKQGIFDKHEKPKYVLCLAFADSGEVISGDSNGNIFIWGKGTNRITQAVTGSHEGGVFSLCVMKNGCLVSGGGKDRKLIQWDSNYKPTGVENEVPEAFGGVRMLSQGKGGMLLVGTTRNCILQGTIDLKLDPVVQGHMDELWGLAAHPSQNQFLTCGSDKQVRLWDSLTRSVVWAKEVADAAHSCCIHPNGNLAAIGTETGRWYVLDLPTHEIVTNHTDGNEQIECLLFSPDGKYLALGSRDNYVYVYEVMDDGRYNRIGRCSGHSSFITHIDWSADAQNLVSNSGDYEVLFWAIPSCKQVTSASSLRDVAWATQNCTLSFNTAGIWPDDADGTDVNNCCRSSKLHLVASADDFGKVNLYSYPACQPKTKGNVYGGHSSHVTSVNFLHDDSRLISTGGRDMSILQWEVV
ncbi:echinoderm microtubule-associated protein-like 2 isoform X2 [Mizuhopecten yessoensis]|uniref:Echinoderm microtubule-associated protein-like 1 n=1 Tax=Mizuhopecten yessoensis TaxID=6573 RepID=A0A210PIF4_MIZYE|nr:echinoderm microtubule-associated protein-like 2 isoform X2 [Mizuhopecten yessoensis]XP_021340863.1 echinoderm microtubule-associated protein-like 2 isoform X2 [Mizuhopecten yessoensis]XP_021340864.1 echinoderm microtubule-associated protein-like 2 isoform X2 [Mizuhopecten yessoensis]OWF36267.1 Echinoderm microtubule-associated protein-like 1 [Mizuhopecten yessoensis]